jgi:hypothetical protein
MDPLNFLFWLIRVFIVVGVVWLLVPYVFRQFIAPHFDGSYAYNKRDFNEDKKTPIRKSITAQNNEVVLEFDKSIPEYRIRFGDDRILSNGRLRVYYNAAWHSSKPEAGEKPITIRSIIESNQNPQFFKDFQGNFKRITVEWIIKEDMVPIVTNFDIYTKGVIIANEPDLISKDSSNKNLNITNLNFIECSIEFPEGLNNCSTGDFNSPLFNFPLFQNESPNERMLGFKNMVFSPPGRDIESTNSPRVFFDWDNNTFLISALDQFIVNITTVKKMESANSKSKSKHKEDKSPIFKDALISCGLEGEIERIEKKHSSSFLIMFDKGINNSMNKFGDILRSYHNQPRKSMVIDEFNSHISYWTDNGAYYYYHPIKGLKPSETILEVSKHTAQLEVPYRTYNIDSWWYQKDVQQWKRKLLGFIGRIVGGGLYGGTIEWSQDPNTMHVNLDELQNLVSKIYVKGSENGLHITETNYMKLSEAPWCCHNRWFSDKNIYKNNYKWYDEGGRSLCLDPAFWDMMMKNCKDWRIGCYEQDWMNNQMKAFKILRNQADTADKWLMTMGRAAQKYGRSIEYCMSNPGMFLTSVKLPAVSFARACGDYNPRWPKSYHLRAFLQNSIFSYSLRLWPFLDVYRTKNEGRINGEQEPELMSIISTLSCGAVGPGDKIGNFNPDTIMRTCRKDGFILKPDHSITATDMMFNPHAKYFISSTSSTISGKTWQYCVINKFKVMMPYDSTITRKDLGINDEKTIVYEYNTKKLKVLTEDSPLKYYLRKQQYIYAINAPILLPGFAIVGDISKYTTMSFSEMKGCIVDKNKVSLLIENIKGEKVQILTYDDEIIKSVNLDNQELMKSEIQLSKMIGSLKIESGWYHDTKMKASLIVFDYSHDSCRKLNFIF